jgi:hypothetical protein
MANPTWSKEMAVAIIKAGFRSLALKHHPDHGGKHEAMLVLEETRKHLEQIVDGRSEHTTDSNFDNRWSRRQQSWEEWTKRQQEDIRRERERQEQEAKERRQERWKEKTKEQYKGLEIPLEPYAVGWYCVRNTVLVQISESGKAFQVMFPGMLEPYWLPRSQLHKSANKIWEEGQKGICVFSAWIAKQKGWI